VGLKGFLNENSKEGGRGVKRGLKRKLKNLKEVGRVKKRGFKIKIKI